MIRTTRLCYGLLFVAACALPCQAANVYWQPLTGDFSNPANWSTGVFPGPGDDARIQNSNINGNPWFETQLGLTAPPNEINSLFIGSAAVADGTPAGGGWLLQTDQTLNVNSQVVVGAGAGAYAGSWSEYDMSGGVLNIAPSSGSGTASLRLSTSEDIIAIMKIRGTSTVHVGSTNFGMGMMYLGQHWNSTGIVRQSDSASVTLNSALIIGYFDPLTTGYYNMAGGSLTMHSGGQETMIGETGSGLFEMSGGSVWTATRTRVGVIGSASFGVINVTGGTYMNNGGGAGIGALNEIGDAGTGIINISGTGTYGANADFAFGNTHWGTGIINVGTGGTLRTTGMFKNANAKAGQLNFHGGTVQTLVDNYNLFNSSNTNYVGDTPADTYVYPEGGAIDTNGKNVIVATPLKAPTGDGVGSVTFDFNFWANSYSAPPVVKFIAADGDYTGKGAAGYAVLDVNGRIESIVVTNPGVDYTAPPRVVLQGGKYGSWNQVPMTAILAPNTNTGGMTKKGEGILALTAVNEYAGDTVIEGGYLALIEGGQLDPTSNVVNNAEFVVADLDLYDITPHTVGSITGTGNTTVYDSSILNATSIVQNSLTLGGTVPFPVAAASAVPEPSTLVLLALAGLGLLFASKKRK